MMRFLRLTVPAVMQTHAGNERLKKISSYHKPDDLVSL